MHLDYNFVSSRLGNGGFLQAELYEAVCKYPGEHLNVRNHTPHADGPSDGASSFRSSAMCNESVIAVYMGEAQIGGELMACNIRRGTPPALWTNGLWQKMRMD
jgi:hypothetical protein